MFNTPQWCVRRLLDVWRPRGTSGILVEPGVGSGNIVRAIGTERFAWLTYDIRDVPQVGEMHVKGDFLKVESCATPAEAVIANPPYCLAEEFIRHSRKLFPGADLVFLLRIAFLASASRLPLWRDIGTPNIYVLPQRPSFTGRGTDSADYAWFLFPPRKRSIGAMQVLRETPKGKRR